MISIFLKTGPQKSKAQHFMYQKQTENLSETLQIFEFQSKINGHLE